jgi:hypothetical protein
MVQSSTLSRIALFVFLAVSLAGCEVVGGIFKAGFWVGAIAVIAIVLVLVFVVGKVRG